MSFGKIISGIGSALGAVNPLLGAAGSIFGGLIGKKGQDDANATNLQIARETNAANRENQEYQNQFNLHMWNTQNAYNSPLAQRERIEDAGFNPVSMGLDGSGNADSLQSAGFTAVPGAPIENSGQFMGAGIMNAARELAEIQNINANTKNLEEDTKGKDIGNQILEAKKPVIIENENVILAINKKILNLKDDEKTKLGKEIDVLTENINVLKEQAALLKQEKFNKQAEEARTRLLSFIDELKYPSELKKIIAETSEIYFNMSYNEAQLDLNSILTSAQVDYLQTFTEHEFQKMLDTITTAPGRYRHLAVENRNIESQTAVNNSQVGVNQSQITLNEQNARFVEKRGDFYVYEVLINGVSSILLMSRLIGKK